jgi:hypothetical protein
MGFPERGVRKGGLQPESTHYCTISHRKKAPKRITRYTSLSTTKITRRQNKIK